METAEDKSIEVVRKIKVASDIFACIVKDLEVKSTSPDVDGVAEGFEEQDTKTNVSNIVDQTETQIAKQQQQRQTPTTNTAIDYDMV